MGRWAQRRRAGGGINQPITIISVSRQSNVVLHVQFSSPVNYLAFANDAFTTSPGNIPSDAIGPVSADTIGVLFGSIITAETSVTYDDDVANVVSPETVPIP